MGVAKFSLGHPLGLAGCYLIAIAISGITSSTLFVQALISCERRRAILATNFIQSNRRFFIFAGMAFFLPFAFWAIYVVPLGGAVVFDVRVSPNSTDTILVCTTADVPFIGGNEVIFTIQSFIIPTSIIVYNYWYGLVWFIFLLIKYISE